MHIVCLQSSPEWLAVRGKYRVTSTAIRDALGVGYTPQAASIEGDILMGIGRVAEGVILDAWIGAGDAQLVHPAVLVEHPRRADWATTTDAIVSRPGLPGVGIAEVKYREWGGRGKYDASGVNDPGERVQCLWHLACTGLDWLVRLAWSGGRLHEDYLLRAEVESEISALEAAADLWCRILDDQAEPAAWLEVAHRLSDSVLRAAAVRPAVRTIEGIDGLAAQLALAKSDMDLADARERRLRADIIRQAGGHGKFEGRDYLVTIRTTGGVSVRRKDAKKREMNYEW